MGCAACGMKYRAKKKRVLVAKVVAPVDLTEEQKAAAPVIEVKKAPRVRPRFRNGRYVVPKK